MIHPGGGVFRDPFQVVQGKRNRLWCIWTGNSWVFGYRRFETDVSQWYTLVIESTNDNWNKEYLERLHEDFDSHLNVPTTCKNLQTTRYHFLHYLKVTVYSLHDLKLHQFPNLPSITSPLPDVLCPVQFRETIYLIENSHRLPGYRKISLLVIRPHGVLLYSGSANAPHT